MFNRVVSFLFLAYLMLTSAALFILALVIRLVTGPFDPRLKVLHLFTCAWASLYTWSMPAWSLAVKGRGRIRKNAAYVIVSNHQSQLDILVAFRLFIHFKWVSKAEVFKLPFIGWNMVMNRYIKLKRGDKDSIQAMMRSCRQTIAAGSSVYMFPEGTRSHTGRLKPFKDGAFQLALETKTPILPVVINGTRRALPKYSLNFHGHHHMTIEVLEEIPHDRFAGLSAEETGEMVRQVLIPHIAEHGSGGQPPN